MAIQLTDSAAQRVKAFIDREGGRVLRLGVRRTGCSGWAYTVSLDQAPEGNDSVFSDRGVTVVVDNDSLPLVDGTEIDFVQEGLNHSFRFNNPNVGDECGCGESFTVKDKE